MGFRGQSHAPAALHPGKKPGTLCTGGWVSPRAGLDGCGKNFFFFYFYQILVVNKLIFSDCRRSETFVATVSGSPMHFNTLFGLLVIL